MSLANVVETYLKKPESENHQKFFIGYMNGDESLVGQPLVTYRAAVATAVLIREGFKVNEGRIAELSDLCQSSIDVLETIEPETKREIALGAFLYQVKGELGEDIFEESRDVDDLLSAQNSYLAGAERFDKIGHVKTGELYFKAGLAAKKIYFIDPQHRKASRTEAVDIAKSAIKHFKAALTYSVDGPTRYIMHKSLAQLGASLSHVDQVKKKLEYLEIWEEHAAKAVGLLNTQSSNEIDFSASLLYEVAREIHRGFGKSKKSARRLKKTCGLLLDIEGIGMSLQGMVQSTLDHARMGSIGKVKKRQRFK